MKVPRVLASGIAFLVFTPIVARAITDTWDGGGGNDLLSTDNNWVDNTAPASDLMNTDLIFAAGSRATPDVSPPFSAHSITFDNTAPAYSVEGLTLSVGGGGIVNNNTQTMAFKNSIDFSGVVNSTINAAAGGIAFDFDVILPTSALRVTGGSATTFGTSWETRRS